MILGSKPFNDLTDAEINAGIEELRVTREALLADTVRRQLLPRAERTRLAKTDAKPRAPRNTPVVSDDIAALLLSDNDE